MSEPTTIETTVNTGIKTSGYVPPHKRIGAKQVNKEDIPPESINASTKGIKKNANSKNEKIKYDDSESWDNNWRANHVEQPSFNINKKNNNKNNRKQYKKRNFNENKQRYDRYTSDKYINNNNYNKNYSNKDDNINKNEFDIRKYNKNRRSRKFNKGKYNKNNENIPKINKNEIVNKDNNEVNVNNLKNTQLKRNNVKSGTNWANLIKQNKNEFGNYVEVINETKTNMDINDKKYIANVFDRLNIKYNYIIGIGYRLFVVFDSLQSAKLVTKKLIDDEYSLKEVNNKSDIELLKTKLGKINNRNAFDSKKSSYNTAKQRIV